MAKTKLMDRFEEDVGKGDLVRLLFPQEDQPSQSPELVGFFQDLEKLANGYYAITLSRSLPIGWVDKEEVRTYVWAWEYDEFDPNPMGYEVLRRRVR